MTVQNSVNSGKVLYGSRENVSSKVSGPVFRKSFYLAFVFRSFSLVEKTAADWLIEIALKNELQITG